jgi:predicted deacylase
MPEMLEHVRFGADDADARAIASAFGTEFLLADTDPVGGDDFAGKFRLAAAGAGVPAITAELSNSRTVQRSAAKAGVEGVWNVLRELDVSAEQPAATPEQRFLSDDAPRVIAGSSGLFELRPDLDVGSEVVAGEELGDVFDPSSFERLETVVASADGVIYSAARGGVVVTGERIVSIATGS